MFTEVARVSFQKDHPEFTVHQVGLLLDSSCPQLGCSPDAILKADNGDTGLLEIKCFPTLKAGHPKDFDTLLSKKQMQAFCLKKTKSGLILKESHYIYHQIQMQLAVTRLKWCYLLLWTPSGMLTLKVLFNEKFWMTIKIKLLEFHSHYLVPELTLMRTPRDLLPVLVGD